MIFEKGYFKSSKIQKSMINESLRESRTFSAKTASDTKTTVFLSHKHKDLEEIEEAEGVIELLEELGAKVYIDSMDYKMPKETSGETALRIKEIIKYCNRFILLATDKAIESYWCNWELGLGDIHKYPDKIAILPVKEKGKTDDQYKGNEYLQIYPRIDYFKAFTNFEGHFFQEGYYVKSLINSQGKYYLTPLKDWLS